MNEAQRQKRNRDKLQELYFTFRRRIAAVLKELEQTGVRPRIQDAWRSPEDQLKAYNSGHSKLKYGFHNVTGANGAKEGLAVDVLDDSSPLKPSAAYLLRLAAAAEKQKLATGIRWGVPAKMAAAIDKAIADKDWQAPVKVGWDPTHAQPTGITVTEAKSGKRPA